MSGDLGVNGERLITKDQARVSDEKSIRLEAYEETSLILIDVPSRHGD
jgi:redox-sensitive bicupin YhaK (pirin superfamily)